MSAVIIGDIHGSFLTFMALLKEVYRSYPNDDIYIVGDICDRGNDTKSVIDYLINHPEIKCVQGNHERMLLDSLDNVPYASRDFFHNGGNKTLASYGLMGDEGLFSFPINHENYIRSLPLYIETDDLIISHTADIRDNWSRSFSVYPLETTKFHIFGHTPVKKPIFTKKFCCIDTGCFYKEKGGYLSAIHYPSKKLIKQENID